MYMDISTPQKGDPYPPKMDEHGLRLVETCRNQWDGFESGVFCFRSSSDFARFLGFPEVSLGHVRVKTPPGLELAPFGHLSSGDILGPGISAWDESWNGMEWEMRRMEVSCVFLFFFRKKGEDIYTTCTCFSRVLVEMVPSKQMPSKIVVPNPPRASQDVWKQVGWKTACPGDCLTDWRNHKWIPFPSIFSYIVRVSSLSTVYIYIYII